MLNNRNVYLFTFLEGRQCFKLTFWAEKPQALILRQEALTLLQICVCFFNMPARVIRVLNPTLPVPQASQYHHISILYVTLKIPFHRDILIMFIIIYLDVDPT